MDDSMRELTQREIDKWSPKNLVTSTRKGPLDRELAREGRHVVWFSSPDVVVTLGFCEHDPDRNVRNMFILAENWSTEFVAKRIEESGFEGIPVGCCRDMLEERGDQGAPIDGDFYWDRKPYVFVMVPAILSNSMPDTEWDQTLSRARNGDWRLF